MEVMQKGLDVALFLALCSWLPKHYEGYCGSPPAQPAMRALVTGFFHAISPIDCFISISCLGDRSAQRAALHVKLKQGIAQIGAKGVCGPPRH